MHQYNQLLLVYTGYNIACNRLLVDYNKRVVYQSVSHSEHIKLYKYAFQYN